MSAEWSRLWAAALASYVVGSIPTAYLIVRWLKRVDVRTIGSGNVGATNAVRAAGAKVGAIVFLFDLGKVLIDFNSETGLQALHSRCSISREQLEEVLWDGTWIHRYERGEISTNEFHAYLRDTANLQVGVAEFFRLRCTHPAKVE